METRGERLRRLRVQKGLSMVELAKAAHCSRFIISRMEAEERGRSADKLPKIARALGCRIDDLFPEMDEVSETPVQQQQQTSASAPTKEPEQEEEDIWAGMDLS